MKAIDLRPGTAVTMDGRLFVVAKSDFTKPGKGPAYVQVKLRDVKGNGYIERRLGSGDQVDATTLDRRTAEYLYDDGQGHVFMDSETFDQFTLNDDIARDAMLYLRPNASATVLFHDENPIIIELPGVVELSVKECEPGVKGATVTNVMKEAIMETGLKTKVPDFIETGETLRISTDDASYMGRAKD